MKSLVLATTLAAVAPTLQPAPVPAPAARDSAYHLLNRFGFGSTPGLVDQVATYGVLRWFDRQLDLRPASDAALRDLERSFEVLELSPDDLARQFAAERRTRLAARDSQPTGPMLGRRRALGAELQQLAVARAGTAENQVLEVMADFWTNHFNVFYGKSLDRIYLPDYIESTIRPLALGRFSDLLIATAKSPAMLVYLDNAQSIAPGSVPPFERRVRQEPRRRRRGLDRFPDSAMATLRARMPTGLNENYARELLELHTMGVDGGYTQQDVVNVARILTGWSIRRPLGESGGPDRRAAGGYRFNEWAHDRGRKIVLGAEFPAGGGEDEGLRLLTMLASHAATMHFVSAKLCARFVNDVPPDGCVDAAVAAWRHSGGDVRSILRALVRSAEFWAPANIGTKVKTPFEFVVSAVRALGGIPSSNPALALAVGRLGQPLYLQSAPTGYPETQADWVNSGALLARMNFAVALAAGRLPGVAIDLDRVAPPTSDPETLIRSIDREILGGRMNPNTHAVILREIGSEGSPAGARALAIGLALGAPEFQRQ